MGVDASSDGVAILTYEPAPASTAPGRRGSASWPETGFPAATVLVVQNCRDATTVAADREERCMNRFKALVWTIVALGAAAVAPAASAAPISKAIQFHTSNGKVTCGLEIHFPSKPATEVLCAARGIPAPKQKSIGDSGFVQLGVLGQPQVLRLSQDSFVAGPAVKLGRGRLWNQVGVTCHVALTTVLCFNGANHGFVIGNGRYRTF